MNTVTLNLITSDVDLVLDLINRKIEKVQKKEVDEFQVAELKKLQSLKSEIECQISR